MVHIDTLDDEKAQQWQRAIFYLYLLIFHRRPAEEHDELNTLVHQQIQETSRREEGETMAQYLIEQGERRGETNARRKDILKLLRLDLILFPNPLSTRFPQKVGNINRSNRKLNAAGNQEASLILKIR